MQFSLSEGQGHFEFAADTLSFPSKQSSIMSNPHILDQRQIAKVWGRTKLPDFFEFPAGERIGEILFDPPPECSQLLVKYLFTSEKLSVQVHPSETQSREGEKGKEECWYVLDAAPGAKLALGLQYSIRTEELREAALNGTIEDLLVWYEVKKGDFFYIPAGTIHAIGAGLFLAEIQQNSDTTYRLYDYDRNRDLHLEPALAVAQREPYDTKYHRNIPTNGNVRLVEGPHFRLDRLTGGGSAPDLSHYSNNLLFAPLSDGVEIDGMTVSAGDCLFVSEPSSIEMAEGSSALVMQPLST